MHLLLIALILEIIVFPIHLHISKLQNDGRKTDQSEEDFNKQIKRWQRTVSALQFIACICLLLNILHTKGII